MGLDVDEVIRVDGIVARHKQDKNKIMELSEQVEQAEDSQIQLKLQVSYGCGSFLFILPTLMRFNRGYSYVSSLT